jgi:SulP family sulfate permease
VAGTPEYWAVAITLAFLSGVMLLAMGLLRLGFLANFLSHPVISGFISASGILIAASQLKTLMGVKAEGHNFVDLSLSLLSQAGQTHLLTLSIGVLNAQTRHLCRATLRQQIGTVGGVVLGVAPLNGQR